MSSGAVRLLAIVLGALVLSVLSVRMGTGTMLMVLAGMALVGVIAFAFRSVQSAFESEETFGDGVEKTTPAEAWKRAALAAIKDLEYERAIGNVGDADYTTMLGTLREDAKRALRAVDDERRARRAKAEAWLGEQAPAADEGTESADSARAETVDAGDGRDEEAVDPTPTPAEAPISKRTSKRTCAHCGTPNEVDAKFCKECAKAMRGAEA